MADSTTTPDAPVPPAPKAQGGIMQWTASVPSNVISMLNPFSNDAEATHVAKVDKKDKEKEKDKPKKDGDAQAQQSANKRTSMFASILPSVLLGGDNTSKKADDNDNEDLTMFEEPDTRSNSDDGSRDGSIFDDLGRRKGKKTKGSKTSYSLCHPAPTSTTRQRLHRRPRSMMQLHKLSVDKRPRPAFEVIPSANFSVRLTKAITRVFRAKHGLCPNDLVVLRAEKYAAAEDDVNEEQDERDIIALICKGRPGDASSVGGKARICLPEGREWEAYPTLNGGYEFFSTDEHGLGLTVRWVLKKGKDGTKPADPQRKKFNFSTISPNSRRHPVIATMGRTGLDINDTYKMPDASAATPLSTPKQGSTILADAMYDEDAPSSPEVCETDSRLHEIIIMTGIWVAFKEGWSPFYKYDDKDKEALGVQRSPSMAAHSPAKSSTFSIASPVSTPPASPQQAPLQKRNSIKSIGSSIARTGSFLQRGNSDNRKSAASVPELEEDLSLDPQQRTSRSRANSNSTVLVHRAASNRRRKNEAAWRPDLLTAQQEAANEDTSSSIHAPSPARDRKGSVDRRSSVARPILPPSHESRPSAESVEMAAPTKRAPSSQAVEKRESNATTATANSRSDPPPPAQQPKQPTVKTKKARGGWRRLLCGAGQD